MFSSDRRIRPVSDMKLPVYHGKSSIFNLIISALLTKAHNMRILVVPQDFSWECVTEKKKISFLNQNIYCGYSKEPSLRHGSFEHSKHMLKIMGKKVYTILRRKVLFILTCGSTSWCRKKTASKRQLIAFFPINACSLIISACWVIFMLIFLSPADFFFKINFFKTLFQEHYQSVKQFGSRSGPTFCRSWSGSKPFAKDISRQKSPLAWKELMFPRHLAFANY